MNNTTARRHVRLGLLAAAIASVLLGLFMGGDDEGTVFVIGAVVLPPMLAAVAGWLAGRWSVLVLLASAAATDAVLTTIDWQKWGGCIEISATCEEPSALGKLLPGWTVLLTLVLFVPCALLSMLARRLVHRRRQRRSLEPE